METKIKNKKMFVRNNGALFVNDGVLLGDWDEVSGIPLSSVTKKDTDTATLDGLIIKGYETKFNVTNENGERYAPNCLDKFVQQYFVDNELNMVVDLQHGWDIDSQIGRVIYLEVNSVGFYFVAYVPRSVARYEQVKEYPYPRIPRPRLIPRPAPFYAVGRTHCALPAAFSFF